MSACSCCTEPSGGILAFSRWGYYASSPDYGEGSGADAWTDAIADFPAYGASSFGDPLGYGRKSGFIDGGSVFHGNAYFGKAKYAWRFYSATCYIKIWWKERTRTWGAFPPDGAPTVETFVDFEEAISIAESSGGLCYPPYNTLITQDGFDYPESAEHEMIPVDPTTIITPPGGSILFDFTSQMEAVLTKYSFLPDYTPPDDGSANGFPA